MVLWDLTQIFDFCANKIVSVFDGTLYLLCNMCVIRIVSLVCVIECVFQSDGALTWMLCAATTPQTLALIATGMPPSVRSSSLSCMRIGYLAFVVSVHIFTCRFNALAFCEPV